MRWVLALAFCIAAGAATWGGLRDDEPGLRLTIHETMPFSDPEDSNVLGRRYWDVRPRFSVARAEKLIELPTASCDAGPLRVFV